MGWSGKEIVSFIWFMIHFTMMIICYEAESLKLFIVYMAVYTMARHLKLDELSEDYLDYKRKDR